MKNKLIAPESYWRATPEEIKKVTNECGPDGILNDLIPDNILGSDISKSCNIHDWMFARSSSQEDLVRADKIFLRNLKIQIKSASPLIKFVRSALAYIYYGAVRLYSKLQGDQFSSRKNVAFQHEYNDGK